MTNFEFEEFLIEANLRNWHTNEQITSRGFFEVKDGWLPLIKNLILELINAGWSREIEQVKQKFAGLRFYIPYERTIDREIIRRYEMASYEICEICGELGADETVKNNWIMTLCKKHISK